MFNIFTDGGLFGPFQQLLRAANSGVLSASNDGALTLGANPALPMEGYSHLPVGISEETTPQVVCDDGYSAGTESENDSPTHGVSSYLFVENNSNDITTASVDYVASFTDPIGIEEFMRGREFDYGDFAIGIDDTDLNDSDFQNHIDLGSEDFNNILNGKASDQSLGDGHAPNDDSITTNDKEISACAHGDCGCSNLVSS